MAKHTELYNIHIVKADDVSEQKKVTRNAKDGVRETLKAAGVLRDEFAYVSKKVPSLATQFQVYATPESIEVLRKAGVEGVARIRRSHKKDMTF